MRLAAFLIALFLASPVNQALARWDEGHVQIAYLAYQRHNAPTGDKVDALLKLNADYSSWTAGAPDDEMARVYAFKEKGGDQPDRKIHFANGGHLFFQLSVAEERGSRTHQGPANGPSRI